MPPQIAIGACLIVVGIGASRGTAQVLRRIPALGDRQHGTLFVVLGVALLVWGLALLIS